MIRTIAITLAALFLGAAAHAAPKRLGPQPPDQVDVSGTAQAKKPAGGKSSYRLSINVPVMMKKRGAAKRKPQAPSRVVSPPIVGKGVVN